MVNLFANIPQSCLLYLFYGLAFLFLGVSIAVKDMKESKLRLAGSLKLLAAFGFATGGHAWLELFLLLQGQYISEREMLWVKFLTVSVVVLSFLFLLLFGLSLIDTGGNRFLSRLKWAPAALFILWAAYLWKLGFTPDAGFFDKANVMARNTLGLVAGLVTAYGLMTYSKEVKNLSLSVSKNLFYTGVVFIFYSVFAGMVPSRSVLPYLSIPVEALRGVSAVLIACFIIKALNIFDIETRKKLEQQLKHLAQADKMASLGQLAAGVAHEINNPLTNASLTMQILKGRIRNNNPDEPLLEKLEAVERNIDRASTIAKELLQFSRPGHSEIIPLDLNNVINSALTLLRYRLNGVSVHKELSDVPEVMGDPVKLEQLFINILSNSVEAMPEGGEIFISNAFVNGQVKVEIADTGHGISEENLSKVFDPFFTTKEIGAGTGLGLSICYGIIKQHNGSIDITSTEGVGTTVTVRLPGMERDEQDTHS